MQVHGITPMKFLLLAFALTLTGCSGWVQHQMVTVPHAPAGFDSRRVIKSTGYRLVHTGYDNSLQPTPMDVFKRFRSPELKVSTLPSGSLTFLFWDSGVPPFQMYSPRFDAAVEEIVEALRKNGAGKVEIVFPQFPAQRK